MSLLTEETLPNPFAKGDERTDKLDALYNQVQDQQMVIDSLFHCIGLLMRAENIRLDRKHAADR